MTGRHAEDPSEPVGQPVVEKREQSWWRWSLLSFLGLFGMAGLAITQPLLDVFGRAPDHLIFRDVDDSDIVAFALVIALVPALVLGTVVAIARAVNKQAGRVAYLAAIGLLAALWFIQLAGDLGVTSRVVAYALGVLLAGLVALLVNVRAVRDWPVYLAVAPVLVVVVFLTASPAADLLGGGDVDAATVSLTREPRPVVIVVFDEWPAWSIVGPDGGIDTDLYPNLAELAGDGAWYRNATTSASSTAFALPAILTGQRPEPGARSPVASAYPESIFTMLASEYELNVHEEVTRLCPPSMCALPSVDGEEDPVPDTSLSHDEEPDEESDEESSALGELLGDARAVYRSMLSPGEDAAVVVLDDAATQRAVSEAANDINTESTLLGLVGSPMMRLDEWDAFLESLEPSETPTLSFKHVLLPHAPYRFLPSGQNYLEARFLVPEMDQHLEGTRSDDQVPIDHEAQRLLMQVAFVDTMVGELTDRLRAQGLYDDAIVVITADHGAGFQAGQVIRDLEGHGSLDPSLYADLLHVPLIIKAPGLDPETVSDANVETIDIVPTVADLLGVAPPWPLDGRSVLGPARDTGEKIYQGVEQGSDGSGAAVLSDERTFDSDTSLAEMLARHTGTLLRDDNPAYRIFNTSDAGELLGADVASLTVGEPSGRSGEIDPIQDTTVVPARVLGRLELPAQDEPATVAVVLDGTVVAVTDTFASADEPYQIDTIAVPSLLVEGRAGLELYLVEGSEGARVLRSIALE